ncbi:NAD(P)/FAD-dependent oxidoreductase [Salinibius halmophilus]|uniref:NAD(P)/FAD-dependent oxidoreductase n=1 Tax=Salinibius halmophilus TaxID=1853216 RepID=UPI000E66398F|nr:FAD-dependent oxidoreductase [Salinibius halmophilus]
MRVAVLGAGMAGASAAMHLKQAGHQVTVIDKSRGVGGRMSTRRMLEGQFDLGAQYFTARDNAFIAQVDTWLSKGAVAAWQPSIATYSAATGLTHSPDDQVRYVGRPAMNAPIKYMLSGINVELNFKIEQVAFESGKWQLGALGEFDALVSTLPPEQALELFPHEPILHEMQSVMSPCLAIGLQLAQPITAKVDAVFIKEHPLNWVARDSSKPHRNHQHDYWLLHCSPAWSKANYDKPADELLDHAVQWLSEIFSVHDLSLLSTTVHRWRYAKPVPDAPRIDASFNASCGLALAGDWLQGGRVEGAWLSGKYAAQQIAQWSMRGN